MSTPSGSNSKVFLKRKRITKNIIFIPSYQISRWNWPSTFLRKDRNNVLQVLQTKPDKYCPVCHFTVATILNVSLPISNTTGKIPIAIWWGQTVQDYHGEVLRLRVSTDVIHLSASGWLLLLQHHGACQLRKERTYVLLIVELMQRTTLNQDSFCFQFPSSYNNNEEIARFVYCLFMKRKRFIWGTALWTKMLDSKMSKTTFFLFIGFRVVSEKKSFNGYSAITLFFQGSARRHI